MHMKGLNIFRWGPLLALFLALPLMAQDATSSDASMRDVLEGEEALERLIEEKSVDSGFTAAQADTPLAAILGLDKSYKDGDFSAAAKYLDLRYLPDEVADLWTPEELIRAIDVIWGQQNILDIMSVSDDPQGHLDDGLPKYRDLLGMVVLEDEDVPVYLQRVPDEQGRQVWKISNATVARIPDMWEEWGYSPVAGYLLTALPSFTLFGMQNWQLLFLILFFVLAWPASILLSNFLMKVALKIPNGFPLGIQRFFRGPIRFFVFILLARTLTDQLGLSLRAKILLESSGIDYIAFTVLVMGLLSLMRDYQIRKLQRMGKPQHAALLTPLTSLVRVIVLIVIGLVWADSAGFNMTTIVAGLGVGSLAVALAAQKTLENLFGAITLYLAQPIKAGDFCRFGNVVGTVEGIGLRSTSIRTTNRTLVMIPNSVFAAGEVENYTERDRIRFFHNLRVQLGTTEQLRWLLADIRRLLYSHPQIQQDTVSVRFEKIEDLSAFLRIDGGVKTQDFQEYLAVAEDLNLRILDAVDAAGLVLAGPGQTVVLQQPGEIDEAKAERASLTLEEWRAKERLPFPDYSSDEIERMNSEIEYPPPGSSKS